MDHNPLPQTFRPQTSPPLTGTLSLNMRSGMEKAMDVLLGLPNGVHFRRFVCTEHFGIYLQCVTTLVEAFSHTLEFIDISSDPVREFCLPRDTDSGLNVH